MSVRSTWSSARVPISSNRDERRAGREPDRGVGRNVSTEDLRLRALEGQDEHPAREAHAALEGALFEVKRVIVGQEGMLERLLVALLAGGHVLLEGVPGLAKTLTIKTVADVL